MSKRKNAGDGEDADPRAAGAAAAGAPQEQDDAVQAEPVDQARAAAPGADPSAEDATVLGETPAAAQGGADAAGDQKARAATGDRETAWTDAPEPPPSPPSGDGGSLKPVLYAVGGALIGGVVAFFAGEATRPTLPSSETLALKAELTPIVEQGGAAKNEIDALKKALEPAAERAADAQKQIAVLKKQLQQQRAAFQAFVEAREEDRRALDTAVGQTAALQSDVKGLRAAVEVLSAPAPDAAVASTPAVTETAEAPILTPEASAQTPESAAGAAAIARLESEVRQLRSRMAGLSFGGGGGGGEGAGLDAARIGSLEATQGRALDQISRLRKQLAELAIAPVAAVSYQAALDLTVSELAGRIAGPSRYDDLLQDVQAYAAGVEIEPALSVPAEAGLPSYLDLSEDLEAASWKAIEAESKARVKAGDGGWVDRFSNLFTFRPAKEFSGYEGSFAEVLDAMENRIADRDLPGALAALEAHHALAETKIAEAEALKREIKLRRQAGALTAGDQDLLDAKRAKAGALQREAQIIQAPYAALTPWREQAAVRAEAEEAFDRLKARLRGRAATPAGETAP